jgi:sugar phosphate isomerase/epimerase
MTLRTGTGLPIGVWLDDLRLDVRSGLSQAAAWRLEAAGLDAFGPELSPRSLSATGRRDLAQRLRAAGAKLAALRADVGGRRLAEAARLDARLARLRDALQLARDLGAPRLAVPLGFIPATDAPDAEARKTLAEAVRALCDLGSGLGVRVAAAAGSEPAGELSSFLHAHDASGLLEVDFNPGLFVSRGQDPREALNALSERVGLCTAADSFRGGGEAPFGKGDVPWGELLIAWSALSRREPPAVLAACSRECDRKAALGAAVERLRALRASPLA